MRDSFALLQMDRRPWVDAESIHRQFLALSARTHPDHLQQANSAEKEAAQHAFAELNAAYQQLRSPKDRLQHLVELESGKKPQDLQQIPDHLVDFFLKAGQLCRAADDHLARKANLGSPLLKVQLFQEGQELSEQLTELQRQLNTWREELEAELKQVDAAWEQSSQSGAERQQMLDRLENLYRLFGFNARWSAQGQERLLRLAIE